MIKKSLIIILMLLILVTSSYAIELNREKIGPELLERIEGEYALSSSSENNERILIYGGDIEKYESFIESFQNLSVIEYDVDDIIAISNNPDVKKIIIEPIYELHAYMDVNVDYINSEDVNALSLNGIKLNGTGNSICILDTGVDYNHPEFNGNVILGPDFVDEDGDTQWIQEVMELMLQE